MNRRDAVVLLVACALVTSARTPQAQESKKLPIVGVLVAGRGSPNTDPVVLRLRELGYFDGKTVRIEWRGADGRLERLPKLARELADMPVDVIVAVAAHATVAARGATASIPIVMAHAGDPVGSGLVASMAHPGGNVTGTTSYAPDAVPKAIELLREVVPSATHLAMLAVPSNAGTPQAAREARAAAAKLGVELTVIGVERADQLDTAFADMVEARADALFVFVDPMLAANGSRIFELVAQNRLPTMYLPGGFAREGGLISYGPVIAPHYPRVAQYVDMILKGAKPADLPVEGSSKFELVINLRTARALGLSISPSLVARADEVIE